MTLCLLGAVAVCAQRQSVHRSSQPVWYTQIGRWQMLRNDRSGRSFLFHNASEDGASSGQATANVRLNIAFNDIRTFRASMMLMPATEAGMLIQDKRVTYYFYVKKDGRNDSIAMYRCSGRSIEKIAAAPARLSDTLFLNVSADKDSVRFRVEGTAVSFANLPEFSALQWIGFECPTGSVMIFSAAVSARSESFNKSFDETGLINLNLDKMIRPASGAKAR